VTSWRRPAIAVAAVLGAVAAGAWGVRQVCCGPSGTGTGAARPIPGEADRVVVEVLNATGATGLARGATRRLRDAGLDVVYFGSDTTGTLDSTEVLLRRGDVAAAERVRRALGAGRVRPAPEPSRLVDVTVRLGADYRPIVRDP
jgi:hypothetical protein